GAESQACFGTSRQPMRHQGSATMRLPRRSQPSQNRSMRLVVKVPFVALILLVAGAAAAQDAPKKSDTRDRINKAWDAQLDRMWRQKVETDCKAQAKERYSAIHFKKRRMFIKNCIEQARR